MARDIPGWIKQVNMWLPFIIQPKLYLPYTKHTTHIIQNTGAVINDLIYLFKLWYPANPFFHARVHKVTVYNTSTYNKAICIQHTMIAIQLQHSH